MNSRAARPFSLLTWNVLANVHVGPGHWYPLVDPAELLAERRRPRIVGELQAFDADIFCLQEVDDALAACVTAAFPRHRFGRARYGGEGQLVGVRAGEPTFQELEFGRKRALLTTLDDGTRILSLHLTWTGRPGDKPRRGVEQLQAGLAAAPDIVCGDLNSFPDWPERRMLVEAGFVDRTPPGPTCNMHAWLQPLDAVYTRGEWHGRARKLPRIGTRTPMPSPTFPSDHLPVFVRFE